MFKKYDAYKDSGIDWIGKIPASWDVKRLKAPLAERNEKNDPIKTDFILSLTMHQGVIPQSEKTGGGNKPKEDLTAYKLARPNDIVLNSMNVIVGSVGLSKYFGVVSPVYYMLYARDGAHTNIGYYNYIFQSQAFQKNLGRLGTGILIKKSETSGKLNTIRMKISMDDLNNELLPIPSFFEQNQIVEFLNQKTSEIDQAIAIKEQQIALLNERKQIVIQKAVTQGLNPNVAMKDSSVEWIGQIPEHWKIVTKLKFISSLKGRQGWQGLKADEYIDEGPFVVSSAHFDGLNIEWHKCPHVSKERYEMDAHIQLKVGDILLMKDGAKMGKLAFVSNLPDLACLNSHLLLIRSLKKADKYFFDAKYMLYFMLSGKFQDYVQVKGTGTTFMGISQESIGNFPLALPSFEEQIEIASFLDQKLSEFDCGKELLLSQIEKLKEYKTTLINDAVTGKIKVA
ncbi:restriction endonuclease subunit S [Acinetobacter towneri]|uniref:restriction endonuclease subunit S n=1 Tax=Acinetobacter towneri TaxID=202956 RepID=UPI002935A539|nr:restriction endonuclease subunit S [Acinetobacter towneri]MDV2454673.1 restriction endonuclease subunit S [Acinetobacter towneri]